MSTTAKVFVSGKCNKFSNMILCNLHKLKFGSSEIGRNNRILGGKFQCKNLKAEKKSIRI